MTRLQKRIAAVVAVALLGAAFAWFFVLPRMRPHVFSGAVIQSNQRAPRMELNAAGGEPVRMTDFEGQVVVVYFGYTFCPDVCPATLSKLAESMEVNVADRAAFVEASKPIYEEFAKEVATGKEMIDLALQLAE